MAAKLDLKGNYLLAQTRLVRIVTQSRDDVTRLWQNKRSDSGSDQSGLVKADAALTTGAFVSQTRQKLGLLGGAGKSARG
jgi:hypothetical protein